MTRKAPTQTDIINRWRHTDDIADDLGLSKVVPRRWAQRNSIPGDYFLALLRSAKRRKVKLTLLELATAQACRDQFGHDQLGGQVKNITS